MMTRVQRPIAIALSCLMLAAVVASSFVHSVASGAEQAPAFFRGLNLNGPPVVIDGNSWEGKDAKNYTCKDKAFEKQDVPLIPATDAERAKMIRSSRWGGNDIALTGVPSGTYTVFLYAWEDNNPETYSIAVNGREVVARHNSGSMGHWEKLGPWVADVKDGVIRLTSQGGAANFSGIEIWRGEHDGLAATELSPEGIEFFEKRIRPLLVKHCYECHSADAKEVEGELLVDSRAGMRKGGYTGPAVVPGDLEQSLLIAAVRFTNEDLQMPPDGKLAAAEIADLETWVKMGAPDPRKQAAVAAKKKIDLEQARTFWSFQPVANPPLPEVKEKNWPLNEVDHFILAELERRGLLPVATADKRTLIRRATFDLTGLPPTPEEIDEFLADESPSAYVTVVERLLASQQYGERWGRHWMDLVRYADTAGENSDYPIPEAYLYRNYIINSLNADKPYDQFIREQIAGDLMTAANDEQRNERTIAAGYIAISRRFGSIIKPYPQHLTIEDTIENLGRTVLGLTINCSRCHDHKFDPISQDDYYGLYGILESTKYPFPGIELDKKPRDFAPLVSGGKPNGKVAYAVSEDKPADTRLQQRGEPTKPLDIVPRKFLDVLGGHTLSADEAKSSGRLQLAQWLTDPQNPLTARVMVNRIWQYHFGSGLVKTPSDFGTRGQPPTHPDLLDYLASRFMQEGWSIKQMHRLMMLSRTYQLSSKDEGEGIRDEGNDIPHSLSLILHSSDADPNNDYHWRFSRRRLDAESLRDTLLCVSGELDGSMMNEPFPFPPVDKWDFTQHYPFRGSYPSNRRSVYLMTTRLNALPFFVTFDGADRNASTPKRDSSVTTIQSLYLLNDEFVHQQAAKFAERLLREQSDEAARLQRAFDLTLGRPLAQDESTAADNYFQQLREQLRSSSLPADQHDRLAWESFARVLFRLNEFLYVD